jgi:hypothetical protein
MQTALIVISLVMDACIVGWLAYDAGHHNGYMKALSDIPKKNK